MGKSKQLATMLTDAPAALDTLDELAAALGDDANFATTVTNSIATKANSADVYTKTETDTSLLTKLDVSNPAIDMGTNKKIRFTGGIGEIGSVPGFQATNDANDGLRSMGLRGTTLRFATGDDERLRIEDNAVGIGTESPSTTDSGYNKGALHVHNASGSGAQVRWTNSTTGTGTSDGFMISKWSDKNTYITNFDDGANTVFTQSNSSGTLVTTMTLDGDGDVGIGITPYANARLTLGGTDSGGYPAVLQFDNNNSSGSEFFMLATDTNWSAGSNKFIMGHGAPASSNADVTIDSGGNVGIGDTNPGKKLAVNGTASIVAGFNDPGLTITGGTTLQNAGKIKLEGAGTGCDHIQIVNDGNSFIVGVERSVGTAIMGGTYAYGSVIGSVTNNPLHFGTNNSVKMTLEYDGSLFFPERSTYGDITMPICSVSNAGSSNRYLHVQFQGSGGDMLHIHFRGYEYIGSAIKSGSGGGYIYNTGGQNQLYNRGFTGNCVEVYQNTANRVELVIDTGTSQTGNRWGSYLFFGGTDTITSNSPLKLVQYSWTANTSKVYY